MLSRQGLPPGAVRAQVKKIRPRLKPSQDGSWTLTEWRPVPDYAVLKVANPTGEPVICHSPLYEIWCFVPDNQY